MANSTLNVTSLDFDTLKANFITFLKSQDVYKDYNFEGSNMNVLLDVMSYNSYLNSFYLNMVSSEMFLDSAQKLDSVVSHAKELNYLPRSSRSAKAVVSFTIDTVDVDNPFIIPKGTIFSGSNSNGSFNYVTSEETSYFSTNSTYAVSNLEIYEGSYVNDTFVIDLSNEMQRFVLSNQYVDTNSLIVSVSEDNGSTNTVYSYASTLYNLTSNSTVYFLQAAQNQKYEMTFGDGVFGKSLKNGAIIYTNYRVSSGSSGNGIKEFVISQDLGSINGGTAPFPTIVVDSPSIGGANAEGIESIRYNAPRYYQTQNRCVTAQDYISLILQEFPEVEHVNVFGGAVTNTNVEYGTVYISTSTYSGTPLPDLRKQDIVTYVNELSPIGIATKIIDPEYLYITLDTTVHVDFKKTVTTPSTIKNKIITEIKNFNVNHLQDFNSAFRVSKLEQHINDSDVGIMSNETYSKIYKEFSPYLNSPFTISLDLQNNIQKGSVTSTSFFYGNQEYVFTDYIETMDEAYEANGNLYKYNTIDKSFEKAGTVNYSTGVIDINQIIYTDIGGGIKVYATPVNRDIYCRQNTILEIDTVSGLTINTVNYWCK